jgi:glutathione peroxidase
MCPGARLVLMQSVCLVLRCAQVLAFPCNQFGSQESGTCDEIKHFANEKFKVTFPMFYKVDVNGPSAHPVFRFLKAR